MRNYSKYSLNLTLGWECNGTPSLILSESHWSINYRLELKMDLYYAEKLQGNLRVPGSMRYLLYTEWASVSKFLHYQPLDYIKEYFGVKIGLYFAWLGFYTHMLIFASVAGVLCFIFGCITLYSNKPSEEICNGNKPIIMCPLCDSFCGYWDLRETCFHGRLTYLFDNPSTVLFSLFMSLWGEYLLK